MPAKKKNAGATAAKKNAKKSQEQAYNAARSKAKDQYLQDKTFGLKNKKKSKNVQQFIHQTTMSVKGDEIRVREFPCVYNLFFLKHLSHQSECSKEEGSSKEEEGAKEGRRGRHESTFRRHGKNRSGNLDHSCFKRKDV